MRVDGVNQSDTSDTSTRQRRDRGSGLPFGDEIFCRLLDSLPVGVYTCDADGLITYFNQLALEVWGRAPRLGDPVDRYCGSFKLYSVEGVPLRHDECWMALALRTGRDHSGQEIVIERPDGSRITGLAHASPIFDDAGKLLGAVNVVVDISDRTRADHAQALLASLVKSSQDAIISKTLDGRILSWNAGAERLFGYTADEAVGNSIMLIIPPDRQDEEREILARIARGEHIEHYETVRVAKDGRKLDISLTVSPIRDSANRVIGVSKVARDITESKQAIAALSESEQRFANFMQHLPGLAWIKDAEGRYMFVNDAAAQAFGKRRDELYGKRDDEVFPPETAARFRENDRQALTNSVGVKTIETLEHSDGWHHSLVSKFAIPGPDGTPTLIGGMAIDITERIKAEQALRESEERFRALAMNAPTAIYIKDLEGRYTLANPLACQALGRPDGVTGLTDHDLLNPEAADALREHDVQVVATGQPFENEEFVERHGYCSTYLSVKFPLYDAKGQVAGVCGVSVDVTERKRSAEALVALKDALAVQLTDVRRLHEMNLRLSNILEREPIVEELLRTAVSIENADLGLVALYNPGTEQLEVGAAFGFDNKWLDELERQAPTHGLLAACFVGRRRVMIEDVAADDRFANHRQAAATARFRAIHCTPLVARSGEFLGVLATCFRDPHRPSDRETHLIDLAARQAVGFIENVQLYDQLREADRRKDLFLATLAHELRNPLAPICNSLHLLRMSDDLTPPAKQVCRIMESQVNHLVRLVDDLLEVSRITTGRIELRKAPAELAAIVANAVETSRPLIESAGHQLAISISPEPMILEADAVRLTQVISNLLNNAAKYTEEGGQIWLTVRPEDGHALVSVKDTGVGIAAEMLPRVFDMFTQADLTLRRAQGGLGIGLTLAKSLVELHGGSLEARSEGQGLGSEFIVRLALSQRVPAAAVPVATPPDADHRLATRRILVVDDVKASAFVLGQLLETMGQQVVTATDGRSALERARAEEFDVVISDIGMPKMDGFELARQVRRAIRRGDMTEVTLVALTGYGQDTDRQQTRDAGFDYHLVKPVSVEALRELLASLPTSQEAAEPRLPPGRILLGGRRSAN